MTLRFKKTVLGVLWSICLIAFFSVNAGAFLNDDWHLRPSGSTESTLWSLLWERPGGGRR